MHRGVLSNACSRTLQIRLQPIQDQFGLTLRYFWKLYVNICTLSSHDIFQRYIEWSLQHYFFLTYKIFQNRVVRYFFFKKVQKQAGYCPGYLPDFYEIIHYDCSMRWRCMSPIISTSMLFLFNFLCILISSLIKEQYYTNAI